MLCQNSHKRQLLSPKHVQRKGEKKKNQTPNTYVDTNQTIGSWLR